MTDAARAGRASRPVGGVAAVAVAAALWGTTGTATHFAPGVPAFVTGAVTFGLGGLVLAAGSGRGTLRALIGRDTRVWVVVGAVALAVYAVAFYAALAGAGVALGTTVAIGSSPVFAGLIELVADQRQVDRRRVGVERVGVGRVGVRRLGVRRLDVRWGVAALVSVGGMVLVTLARPEGGAESGSLAAGVGWALVAGLTYAVYSWAVACGMTGSALPAPVPAVLTHGPAARDAVRGSGRGVVGAVFGLAAVPLVVLAVVGGHDHLTVAANWPVFLWLALVPTVIGHTLYAVGLRSVGASVGTLVSLLEPVVAAVLAMLVVGEHLGAAGWTGVVLVVLGLGVLAVPSPRR